MFHRRSPAVHTSIVFNSSTTPKTLSAQQIFHHSRSFIKDEPLSKIHNNFSMLPRVLPSDHLYSQHHPTSPSVKLKEQIGIFFHTLNTTFKSSFSKIHQQQNDLIHSSCDEWWSQRSSTGDLLIYIPSSHPRFLEFSMNAQRQ